MEEDITLSTYGTEKNEKQTHALQPSITIEEGYGTSEDLGRFHRSFTPRQVHVRSSTNTRFSFNWIHN